MSIEFGDFSISLSVRSYRRYEQDLRKTTMTKGLKFGVQEFKENRNN